MNNALNIHKSEGMNVAHLQGGNLGDGVLGNTGGSTVESYHDWHPRSGALSVSVTKKVSVQSGLN